jgi:ribosomal protein L7/L12
MPGEYTTATLTAHFETTNRRLDHIEQQLQLLAKTVGVPYATWAESENVPDEVIELARAGKTLEAVGRYRELTGANLEQARSVVAGL